MSAAVCRDCAVIDAEDVGKAESASAAPADRLTKLPVRCCILTTFDLFEEQRSWFNRIARRSTGRGEGSELDGHNGCFMHALMESSA